jgi:hypothetical protein
MVKEASPNKASHQMRAESLTPLTLPVIIPAVRGRYARSRRRVSPGEGIPCWDERET